MRQIYVPSTYRRLLAHIVDSGLRGLFFLPVILQGAFHFFSSKEWSSPLYLLVSCWLLDFCFRVLCLRLMSATPGKLMMGLEVVPRERPAAGLSWMQALLRTLADQLAFFFSWGLWSLALFRHDRTHLSDWLAETRVVQFSPRFSVPKRRWLLGVILVLYFSISGWTSAHRILSHLEFSKGRVLFKNSIPD